MAEEKVVIIGGGVGPMAGVALHARIIENTMTDGSDQQHLQVHHYSRSSDVSDRTEYLLGREKKNPSEGMARTFVCAWSSVKTCGKEAVGGVPCNTFHAPEIFNPFIAYLEEAGVPVPVLDMLNETALFLDEVCPRTRKIGVLSTTGTRKTGVYRNLLAASGREIVEVEENRQDALQEAIYNRVWGIKAVSPVSIRARERMMEMIDVLITRGAEAIILGCTEIPLALPEKSLRGVLLVDPVLALARALIREAAPNKLGPL